MTVACPTECGRPTPKQVWTRRRRATAVSEKPLSFTPFIVGGRNAEIGKWPWIVLMGYTREGLEPFFFCGGALINSQYILTAAHCLHPRRTDRASLVVRLGEYDTSSTNDGANPQDYGVETITNHQGYQEPVLDNDLSLVKLDRPVELTDLIKPVCLPAAPTGDYEDEKVDVAGWGYTDQATEGTAATVLQEVQLTAVAIHDCQAVYEDSVSFRGQFPNGFGDTKLCAGEDGKSACRGDSGGPMVRLLEDGRYELVGVVSAGVGCGTPGQPGLYTRVSAYLDWIQQTMVQLASEVL